MSTSIAASSPASPSQETRWKSIIVIKDQYVPYDSDFLYSFFRTLNNHAYQFDLLVIDYEPMIELTLDSMFKEIFFLVNLTNKNILCQNSVYTIHIPYVIDLVHCQHFNNPKQAIMFNKYGQLDTIRCFPYGINYYMLSQHYQSDDAYSVARQILTSPQQFNFQNESHLGIHFVHCLHDNLFIVCYDVLATSIPVNSKELRSFIKRSGMTSTIGGLTFLELIFELCQR